eukprot:TRINITY_DN5469_c0_g1_i3.p1 TRINITY_DN5469_c0_g1~~TRINITY_DN5469_c0_g1_i3.p1  ORF type:complete len:114 (-),score=19.04 TRINITY_DN5469_c0_g1_i3:222-563(-)
MFAHTYVYEQSKGITNILALITFCYNNYGWIMAAVILHSIFFPFLAALAYQQTMTNVYLGITTNEWANKRRYLYLVDHEGKFTNPYNKGFIGNLMTIINPPRGNSNVNEVLIV